MKALPTALSTDPKSLPEQRFSVARVALDVPLPKLFHYVVAEAMQVRAGDRVIVPFGARQRIGVVIETSAASEVPAQRMKSIAALRDDAPTLSADWLELMRFLAAYYQRPLGETMISALPPRLRSIKALPRKSLVPPEPGAATFKPEHTLTRSQKDAVARIGSTLGRFAAFLLHGVTGSGKTEVYQHLVAEVLRKGGQAMVLVPEISLTPQLEGRFRQAFPDTPLAVMHSGLEDIARTRSWLEAARGDAGLVLGTRLAMLAPLPRLDAHGGRR